MFLFFDRMIIGLRGTYRRVLYALIVFSMFILDLIDIIFSVFDMIKVIGFVLPFLLINSGHIVRLRLNWIAFH